ncbi:methyltransferase-like protein 6 [Lingula anatina]|uniref:tRNA N(3)-cytidine methyltransferase METTL6 n=1 Tax=Lingula anatina TaxID=7574 RepID=A0A1S3JYN9_LINAN|nr:methyltransferase-like protein 6 [Lingula anatina]|eukprot:XP_013415407.1 methyltransferase-like protein 6 [Lingula anatina]
MEAGTEFENQDPKDTHTCTSLSLPVSNSSPNCQEETSQGNGDNCTNIPVPSLNYTGSHSMKTSGHHPRTLTEEEAAKLSQDTRVVNDFKQMTLEKEAQKNWDKFYKRNSTKFFKDRHWTSREFRELSGFDSSQEEKKIVLEVGCGVGNFLFPLLGENPNLFFYACDFSPRAVQFVKDHPLYNSSQCMAFQCDLTQDPLLDTLVNPTVDIVSMIFVLSAIHPEKMLSALENIYKVLKPGGCVLVRDYGLYDYAQLRFSPGQKLAENFYVRQDGTRAYYFSTDYLSDLFARAGYQIDNCDYVTRETVNKKEGLCVPRIFVQGKFIKMRS